MAGTIEFPAQEAQRCKELRINRDALQAMHDWKTAVMMARYNGKPLPVSFSKESYDQIVMLLTKRQLELE